uniref:Uncharacterized protein n=1 Tax=Glossina austeni TaxID=7395 RepID=A0A1A9VWK6_GLOAU
MQHADIRYLNDARLSTDCDMYLKKGGKKANKKLYKNTSSAAVFTYDAGSITFCLPHLGKWIVPSI